MKAYMNWSGGKDSALALYRLQQEGVDVSCLFTSLNAVHDRVSMHGVRRSLLLAQAEAIGLPLHTVALPEQPGREDYDSVMQQALRSWKKKGYTHAAFGDIFLKDLRQYREQQGAAAGLSCLFPLWKRNSADLLREFLALGFRAIVVCVNGQYLDKLFCGRMLDETFIADLPKEVDVCGERGEYHSFVFEGPLFRHPVHFEKGGIVYREYKAPVLKNDSAAQDPAAAQGFYFCDLLLK